ncbi:MAG: ABC transporter permease [Anaerolineales bacterium]|nr:ABC transporter permease [Anaerolineales bacterium]
MAVQTISHSTTTRARITTGIVLLVIGMLMFLLFTPGTEPGQTAKFGMNLISSAALKIPDIIVPVQTSLYVLSLLVVFLGAFQMARGIKSRGALLGMVAFAFVAAFLLWATKGKSLSLIGMVSSSLVRATPIALAALCGVISERAGVTNIAIEGIMLISAQTSVVSATVSGSLYVGLVVGILTGGLVAAFHALLSIRYKVDQIVSGVAINIFATGATSFISSKYLQSQGELLNNSGTFPIIPIPLLSKIPILGTIFFENNLVVYLTILIVIVMHIVLYYTPWGLRTRSVGEHPKAADTLGINVFFMRYMNVIIGGFIAGLGGAYFTLGSVGRFDEVMTAGKGFIGLAAMIFGNWNPIGAFLASLIFGFADSLQIKMQILSVPIPSSILAMAPYLVTMLVLTGVVGKAIMPAADGVAYEKQ